MIRAAADEAYTTQKRNGMSLLIGIFSFDVTGEAFWDEPVTPSEGCDENTFLYRVVRGDVSGVQNFRKHRALRDLRSARLRTQTLLVTDKTSIDPR
jgi:hypothetical protein